MVGPWCRNRSQGTCSLKGVRRGLCGISWASAGRGKASFKFQCSLDGFIAWMDPPLILSEASKAGQVLGTLPPDVDSKSAFTRCYNAEWAAINVHPSFYHWRGHGDMDAGSWSIGLGQSRGLCVEMRHGRANRRHGGKPRCFNQRSHSVQTSANQCGRL
jgi:hypothetical protein